MIDIYFMIIYYTFHQLSNNAKQQRGDKNMLIPVKGGFVGEYENSEQFESQNTDDMVIVEKEVKPTVYKINFPESFKEISRN